MTQGHFRFGFILLAAPFILGLGCSSPNPSLTTPSPRVNHFVVACPPAGTAGAAVSNITVIAVDGNDQVLTGFNDPVQLTSTDGAAVLPAQFALGNGVTACSVTFKTSGNQTLTATDPLNSAMTGSSNAVTVLLAAATHFVVVAPSTATQFMSFNFTVTAEDAYGNIATFYAGTVDFNSTSGGSIPVPSMLTNGTYIFSAGLGSLGSQTITATDSVTSSIHGTSNPITVVL